MAQSSRTFRVFISSTFSDMKAERNALQERVFPRLRKLAENHHCHFQAIDLRWGVSEEASFDQQTMKICLGEIKRCQEISPRPNFIILLGNRYGWKPLPFEIAAEEYKSILNLVSSEEQKLLEKWYRRDDNAVPPHYVLQPRTGEFENYANWQEVESNLHQVFIAGAKKLGLPSDSMFKYDSSATEQEIVSGALQIPDAHEHVFCFLRDIPDLPENKSLNEFVETDPHNRQKLSNLKNTLRKQLLSNVHEYSAPWMNGEVSLLHLEQLCDDVYSALSEVMLAEIGKLQTVDPIKREESAHELFAKNRTGIFVGRKNVIEEINKYIRGKNSHPLVIWGASGSGKSTLMAKAILDAQKFFPKFKLVYRFIGTTPESSNGRALLESLLHQIIRISGGDENEIPTAYNDLAREFEKILAKVAKRKPILLFLDALDQLEETDEALNFAWLPNRLPENVKIVFSAIPGPNLEKLNLKMPAIQQFELKSMSMADGKTLLSQWLEVARRTLQSEQFEHVINKYTRCSTPLFLRLAFEDACRWRSYDPLPEMSEDVPGLIQSMIARLSLESNHGKMLVERSLGYLAAAKNGLSENEILELLSLDSPTIQDFYHRSPLSPHVNHIPVVIWSRLFSDLEPYLAQRVADDSVLITFYHRVFATVVEERILSKEQNYFHQKLASFFEEQELTIQKNGVEIPNLRKISELPFHQAIGKMWRELECTLCNLLMIEIMCKVSRLYELIADFDMALLASDMPVELQTKMQEYVNFLRAKGYLLIERPSLTFQLAANQVDLSAPAQEAQRLFKKDRSPFPWLRWLNKPKSIFPHDLVLFSRHEKSINSCAFSPDGLLLASGAEDQNVMIWDTTSGRMLSNLHHDAAVKMVRFSPDGKQLITISGRENWWGEVLIWNVNNGQLANKLPLQLEPPDFFIFSKEGGKIITAKSGKKCQLKAIDLNSCEQVNEQSFSDVAAIQLVANQVDQSQILLIDKRQNTGEVLDSVNLKPTARLTFDNRIKNTLFGAILDQQNMIYAFGLPSQLLIFDGKKGMVLSETPLPFLPQSLCVSEHNIFIAGVADEKRHYGELVIMNNVGGIVGSHRFPSQRTHTTAYSATKNRIAVGLENGEIHCWTPTYTTSNSEVFNAVSLNQYIVSVTSDSQKYLSIQITQQAEKYPNLPGNPVGDEVFLLSADDGKILGGWKSNELETSDQLLRVIKMADFSSNDQHFAVITSTDFNRPIIHKDDKLEILDTQSMSVKWSGFRTTAFRKKSFEIWNKALFALGVSLLVPIFLIVLLGIGLRSIVRRFYAKQFQRIEENIGNFLVKISENIFVQPWWKKVQHGAYSNFQEINPCFIKTQEKESILVSNGQNLLEMDLETGKILSDIEISIYGISSFAVAPDQNTVAVCTLKNKDAIQLVNLDSKQITTKISLPVSRKNFEPLGVVWEIAWCGFSPDGKYFAAAVTSDVGDCPIHFWTSDLQTHLFQIPSGYFQAWGPDSKTFCVWNTHMKNRLTIWSVPDPYIITEFAAEGWPAYLKWNDKTGILLASTRDGNFFKLSLEK